MAIETWTGAEARLLRTVALRMSVREFAAFLGVPARTISKWEQHGGARQPRPAMQAVLDAALLRADTPARVRFAEAVNRWQRSDTDDTKAVREGQFDLDAWSDDIDRARLHVDRQDFSFAARLMTRWIDRTENMTIDPTCLYLKAQSLVVLGNVRRDQGLLSGPRSASRNYDKALELFSALRQPRRVAQVELLRTVLTEMSGDLANSVRSYRILADDRRLSDLDRARARLWVGTALTKGSGGKASADMSIRSIQEAIRTFEVLDEPDEWHVAQQKLALARLSSGDLAGSLEAIEYAVESRRNDSPLQQVRLDTAYGHILCADAATRETGLVLLDETYQMAAEFELAHQMVSIDRIRTILNPAK